MCAESRLRPEPCVRTGPLVQARGCLVSGSLGLPPSSLVISFYRVYPITYGSMRCVIAFTWYSEPPRYGVSWKYHGTGFLAGHGKESLGACGTLLTEVLRATATVRSSMTLVSLTYSTVHTVHSYSNCYSRRLRTESRGSTVSTVHRPQTSGTDRLDELSPGDNFESVCGL